MKKEKTKQLKTWQHSQIQYVMELKKSKCDKTPNETELKIYIFFLQKSKTQNIPMRKLKMWQKNKNSKSYKISKLKMWQNLKHKLGQNQKKSKCDETKKFNVWQNLKTPIGTKIKSLKREKKPKNGREKK